MADIYVFSPNEDNNDYSTMGLVGALVPTKCRFTESANGDSSITMTHPLDDYGRYQALVNGNLIVAPVPTIVTPEINNENKIVTTIWTYKVKDKGLLSGDAQRTLYRKKTGSGKIKILPYGEEVTVVAEYDKPAPNRWKVKTSKWGTGWINPDGFDYVDTHVIADNSQSIQEIQAPWTVTPQYFRIVNEQKTNTEITVTARHIRYDLLKNMTHYTSANATTKEYNLVSLPEALGAYTDDNGVLAKPYGILGLCYAPHPFRAFTNVSNTRSGLFYKEQNIIESFLNPEDGICQKFDVGLVADNYNLYFLHDPGTNRGIRIQYGKNMTKIDFRLDEDEVITRIIPVGETKDGEDLYLSDNISERYIDSPNINNYPIIHTYKLACTDCKVGQKEQGGGTVTITSARARMRQQAQELLDSRVDQPRVTMKVDYITLGDSEEYSQFKNLENSFLWDYIIIQHGDLGIDVTARIVSITWDVITERMVETTVGEIGKTLANTGITTWNIPSGFSGTKIAGNTLPGSALESDIISVRHVQAESINTQALQANSVTAEKIQAGVIDVDKLNADSVNAHIATITTAEIKKAVITEAQIEDASIGTAKIKDAAITNAKIADATIDVGKINQLSAAVASILTAYIQDADIGTALIRELEAFIAKVSVIEIGSADINWANIKDSITGTAIIHEGIGGKLFIDRLAVNEANFVSITTNELVVKGTDGKFYTITVDEEGKTTATEKTVEGINIADDTIEGRKIIESTITARELNVSNIFADKALIGAIKAGNLASYSIQGHHLSVDAIEALNGVLDLSANSSLQLLVSNMVTSAKSEFVGQQLTVRLSNGAYLDDEKTSTHASAHIFSEGREITDTIPKECFIWERSSSDTVSDTAWNTLHRGRKEFDLTGQDINFTAVIKCYLDFEETTPKFFVSSDGALNWEVPVADLGDEFWIEGESLYANSSRYYFEDGNMYAETPSLTSVPTEITVVDRADDPYTKKLTAEILLLQEGILLRAKQTTVDALAEEVVIHGGELTKLDSRLTTQTGTINVLAGNVALKADNTRVDALGQIVSQHGSSIDLLPGQITQAVQTVRVGGVNIPINSAFQSGDFTGWDTGGDPAWWIGSGKDHPTEMMGYNYVYCSSSTSKMIWCNEYQTISGDHTVSFYSKGVITVLAIGLRSDGEWNHYSEHPFITYVWEPTFFTFTFQLPSDTARVRIIFRLEGGYSCIFSLFKLEIGNKPTAWSPNPQEFYAGSKITMREELINLYAKKISVTIPRLSGGSITDQNALIIDENGVFADNLISSSVSAAYAGSIWLIINVNGGGSYRSIKEVATILKGKYLPNDVYIILTAGQTIYDDFISFEGIHGVGVVRISGASGVTIVSRIDVHNCSTKIMIYDVKIITPAGNSNGLFFNNASFVHIERVIMDANNATIAIALIDGSKAYMGSTEIYNSPHLLWVERSSTAYADKLKGSGSPYSLVCVGGIIMGSGTIPGGSISRLANGQIYVDGVPIDYGNAQPPVSPVATYKYTAIDAAFYRSAWNNESKRMRQGFEGGYEHTGGVWFDIGLLRSNLSGKTILSTSIEITRQGSFGKSSGIELHLYGMTNSGPSGAPNRVTDYGIIGKLSQKERLSFGLPTTVGTHLANGTINSLAVYAGDGKYRSGELYSENYGYFYGAGEDPIVLTIMG